MTIEEMMNSIDESALDQEDNFEVDPKVEEFTNKLIEFTSELPEVDEDSLSESVEGESSDINLEKFYDLCESVQEYFESVSEAAEELEISTVLETTSKEMLDKYKIKKKEYKDCIKTLKKSIKSGDIAAAKKSIKEAQDIISEFEDLIKSYDSEHQYDTYGQVLLSSWYATVAQLGEITVEVLKRVGIGSAAGLILARGDLSKSITMIGAYVSGLIKSIKTYNSTKEAEKNKTIKSRTKIDGMTSASLSLLTKMKETLSKLESQLEVKEKKTVKESFDLDMDNSDLFGFPTM